MFGLLLFLFLFDIYATFHSIQRVSKESNIMITSAVMFAKRLEVGKQGLLCKAARLSLTSPMSTSLCQFYISRLRCRRAENRHSYLGEVDFQLRDIQCAYNVNIRSQYTPCIQRDQRRAFSFICIHSIERNWNPSGVQRHDRSECTMALETSNICVVYKCRRQCLYAPLR